MLFEIEGGPDPDYHKEKIRDTYIDGRKVVIM